jgi:Outer membrane protein beta-barrel domain
MKKTLLLIFIFCGLISLNAQNKQEFQIGLAMPSGDFADDDNESAIFDGSGGAANGFYIGYKLLAPIDAKGLFWTFSAGIMYNSLNSDLTEDIEDNIKEDNSYEGNLETNFTKYINIPVMVGLQYETILSSSTKLFGEVGLGLNILKLTNMSMSYDVLENNNNTYEYESNTSFDPSFKLGYKIGGGLVIKDKYTIGLIYMGLGSHKVKYEGEEIWDGEKEKYKDKFEEALSISSLNLTFGFRF